MGSSTLEVASVTSLSPVEMDSSDTELAVEYAEPVGTVPMVETIELAVIPESNAESVMAVSIE